MEEKPNWKLDSKGTLEVPWLLTGIQLTERDSIPNGNLLNVWALGPQHHHFQARQMQRKLPELLGKDKLSCHNKIGLVIKTKD